ncbi:hypothetical protein [Amycolatopsis sp. VC5-11]|uniref:hypothetical protein n=1 Tax=Amycolatopsis sp. VC5-11 TaxID=3120156 RepID=UPI00300ACB07
MPGRVPWERYSGDDVEAAIVMLLLRQHRRGQRIRPSQGDGGIDVLVPHSSNRWEVFQVKKFATTRDNSHERQITKSWNRLLSYTQEKNIHVTAWHVVRPLDPTHGDREWLAELTKDSGIPADWIGLTTVDNWAADYPQVIDYWFRDGQEYVNRTALTLAKALNASDATASSTVLRPSTALTTIQSIADALNNADPHYAYRLSAGPAPDDAITIMTPPRDAAFSAILIDGNTMSQLDIIERYNGARLDRPLPVDLRVTITPNSDDTRQQLDDFLAYGIPFRDVPADVAAAQLPGGLTFSDTASISVSVVTSSEPKPFDLRVLDENGDLIATMKLLMDKPTDGIDGTGRVAWTGQDVSGVIAFTFRINSSDRTVQLQMILQDISGADPAAAADSLAAAQALRSGNRARIGIPGGPASLSLDTLTDNLLIGDTQDDVLQRLAICSALRTLQAKIPRPLTVPDMSTVTECEVVDWLHAATILEGGRVISSWSSLTVSKQETAQALTLPCWIALIAHLTVSIDGTNWNVGHVQQAFIAEHLTSADDGRYILTPGEDTKLILEPAPGTDEENESKIGQLHAAPLPQP